MSEQTALSGKELARQRRAMMSQQGKTGLAKPGASAAAAAAARAARVAPTPAAPPRAAAAPIAPVEPAAPVDLAVAAAALPTEAALDEICDIVERDPGVLGAQASSVRAMCRQRRQALASEGKRALPPKPGARTAARKGGSPGGQGANGGSCRDWARQRRAELCRNGRGDAEACRPSGRTRPRPGDAPDKVETGTTLSGQVVTGTQVERKSRVTGNEAGTCRTVTGTEYIGAEQFETFCEARPGPGPAKVGTTTTSRSQSVSGTEVGRSSRVTGDEAGACRAVTGTEYLGSERFAEFCAGRGMAARPEKVAVGATEAQGNRITGSDEARIASRVTGAEPGAARPVTGSPYADAGAARLTINGPTKVALTHTLAGRAVSGTEVGRSVKVTGDEAGGCRQVSGTEYLSNEHFASVCQTRPAPGPAKVGVDSSQRGQSITGNLVDRTEKVTGNEPGSCRRVTGSQYGGAAACAARVAPPAVAPAQAAAGCGCGCGGACGCGAGRGGAAHGAGHAGRSCACAGQVAAAAPRAPGIPAAMRRSARAAWAEPVHVAPIDAMPAPLDFSIHAPARRARDAGGRLTGASHGGGGRITGPVNLASRLVSGTPEFRYHDGAGAEPATPPVTASFSAPVVAEAAPPSRITGDGRDAGTRITGDDWARSGRITGTEGPWSQGRNPTLRGAPRGQGAGAWLNMERERPEVPPARITGSSGNAGKGALITVSGGARG